MGGTHGNESRVFLEFLGFLKKLDKIFGVGEKQ